jgi:pimeloyl-ACP methyl ester carboxylesterase
MPGQSILVGVGRMTRRGEQARGSVFALLVVMVGTAMCAAAQSESASPAGLPSPTGPFAIGRVTVHWIDPSRIEPFSVKPRELMVDIWYPTDSAAGAPAEYLNVPAFEQALGADGLRKQLGGAYRAIKAGSVRTHAIAGAPFARSMKQCPVLIFSPGGGMVREVYAAQLGDLASHGYVVGAISHPYDAIVTVFPDGSHINYDQKRWPTTPSFEGESNLNQLEWHADDIRFVLDELSRSNEINSSLPFAGHLNLSRVGAFGHSFGGIAAAHACQEDLRIKACLNQDGEVGMRPFYLDGHGWGMDQAFMFIERAPPMDPPSDNDLEEMKVTRERAYEIMARLKAYKGRVLRSTGKGAYHVTLQSRTTTHMDFSDLPVLGARDGAEAKTRERVLEVVRDYTRTFFDHYLKGLRTPLLDGKSTNPLVENVQRLAPAKRSNDD